MLNNLRPFFIQVPYTNKIHYAYYLSIIVRLVMEGIFIYFGYVLFKQMVMFSCFASYSVVLCNDPFFHTLFCSST